MGCERELCKLLASFSGSVEFSGYVFTLRVEVARLELKEVLRKEKKVAEGIAGENLGACVEVTFIAR